MTHNLAAMETELEPFPQPQIELIDSDGEPLETEWHRYAMNLLIDAVNWFYRDRDDFFAGGDMFIYFSEDKVFNKDFRGPDFFFVWGVDGGGPPRRYYVVWQEGGHYPDVIIELMSPSTIKIDLTLKKDLYQDVFKCGEYFCYDPLTEKLLGWRLVEGLYETIQPGAMGRLESKELDLHLGTWAGTYMRRDRIWLRFYTPDGKVVPTFAEAAQKEAELAVEHADEVQRRADAEQRRADTEQRRADTEQRRADTEQRRAEEERRRADAAVAELEKLKAQLQDGDQKNGSPA